MSPSRFLAILGVALALGLAGGPAARAGDEGPTELVHVPSDELDVLLRADRQGIVLKYGDYRRLLAAAAARRAELEAQPPVDGTLVACTGSVDLTGEDAARLELRYAATVLADGPRSIPFPLRGLGLEDVVVQDPDGLPNGRYEEWKGRPRLRFDQPGERTVTAHASAAYARKGEVRLLDLGLPPASAMSLTLRFPPGVEGFVQGEGPPTTVHATSRRGLTVHARPARDGRLRVGFAPAAKGTEAGPPILDTRSNTLHTVGDGIVHSREILQVDVFRSPVRRLVLETPAGFALRALSGRGVTGFARDEASGRVSVQLEKPVQGTVGLVVEGDVPYRPGPDVELPLIRVQGAVRHLAVASVQFGRDVRVRGFHVRGGKRLPASTRRGQRHLLRFALDRADARLAVALEAGAVRLDATSTYYLNLAEAGKTLLATTSYRVLEGTVFALHPRMPGGYELRSVTVDGKTSGFTRDLRPDGRLEISLARGVPEGGRIALAATLEQSQADWVGEGTTEPVPFQVPSAGATREEGFVGVGADAAFRVLQTSSTDLVPVGAGELAAHGISATGLVYGYRLDGPKPGVALSVRRHEPVLEAQVVTTLLPSPKRLDVVATVMHRIRRAGVRQVFVDVPAWAAQDQVRFDSPFVRGAHRLSGDARPADVPAGYERWRVEFNQRVIGRHATVVRYFRDEPEENWSLDPETPLGVRVPLPGTERFLVVQRAQGLEVRTTTERDHVRSVELADLPAGAGVNALRALDVLRVTDGPEGVGLSVRRHDGAAVLDAVATRVALRTAVAREGVLRTRAEVSLFNVDRQFLKVLLPRGSELIGAVVDGAPVKALTDPAGALLVPVRTARRRGDLTRVAFTYETRLGHEVEGHVRVPGPLFPELEVIQSEHRVGFDSDVRIAGVSGDYGTRSAPHAALRVPWVVSLISDLAVVGSASKPATGAPRGVAHRPTSGPVATSAESSEDAWAAGKPQTDNDLPQDERATREQGLSDAPFEGPAVNGVIGVGGGAGGKFAERRLGELQAQLRKEQARLSKSRSEADKRVVDELKRAVESVRRLQREDRKKAPSKPKPKSGGRYNGPGGAEPPAAREPADAGPPPPPAAPAPPPAGGARGAGQGGSPAKQHQEGGMPPRPGAEEAGRPARRKGLLSLDVPVLLGPKVVVAQRLGQGGVIDIDLGTRDSDRAHFEWLLLGLLLVGALAGYRRPGRKHLVVWGGIALAGALQGIVGSEANTLTVAVADAATALGVVWGGRWLLRRVARLRRRPAAAALLVVALLAASAGVARADEPRPPLPKVKKPRRIYVPYDPADPTGMKTDDRIFLPLDTYLELYKAAHPESDPEVVSLGRMVTLLQADYSLEVASGPQPLARGTARFRFAKRGRGTMLVRWPLGGLAVSEATLDGKAVRLLLDRGVYHVAITKPGDHLLELGFRAPVLAGPDGRSLGLDVVPFAGSRMDLLVPGFDGDVRVSGAGRVETHREAGGATRARAWLGAVKHVAVRLAEKAPAELPTTVRTRAEGRTIHSVREEGTETQADLTVFVLQGKAPFVDLGLAQGVTVLSAGGPNVVRWEVLATPSPRLRLTFAAPVSGAVKLAVRTFRPAAAPERSETLPSLPLLATTGESGDVVVNADPSLRLDALQTRGLFRMGLPKGAVFAGADGRGRVTGAWRFAARPASIRVRARRLEPRVDLDTIAAVVFGDDRVRSGLLGHVDVDPRAPLGRLDFSLPGEDDVLRVTSPGMDTWWLEGQGAARRLHVRYADLRTGRLDVHVQLERKLHGLRDAIAVPRWSLEGARRDRGEVTVFATPDVDLRAGSVPGLRSLPVAGRVHPATGVANARAVHAYAWDAPLAESLPVGLRTPELDTEAVVVTVVSPGDEFHGVEQLVLFDVRRGATDRLRLFVPDGAEEGRHDVVSARDLREVRKQRAVRRGADGKDVPGTIYDLLLQSPQDDVVEVTVSQRWNPRDADGTRRPVRLVRPDGVVTTHWFALVRTFLDGDVQVGPAAGRPDVAAWSDLPFVKAGLTPNTVVASYTSGEPFSLSVVARRHELENQSPATVQAAVATVVVGLDGQARVRMDYSVFNRARQFLRLKLPEGALLFGATSRGTPVKPLAGRQGTILLPVPKVPLGGRAYPVSLLYRARAGAALEKGGSLSVLLPKVEDVEVDRTVVRLFLPDGYDYDFDTGMGSAGPSDVAADLADAAVREARDLLKLAETGTLVQRQAAARNGLYLIERARARLSSAPDAWVQHRGLASELNQVGKQLEAQSKRIVADVRTARRERQAANTTQEEYASNARQIVDLETLQDAHGKGRGGTGQARYRAGWVLNRAQPQQHASQEKSKQQFDQLRARLESKLAQREAAEAGKASMPVAQTKAPSPSGQAALLVTEKGGATTRLDPGQVLWLNGQIRLDQERNNQLGAVDPSKINTVAPGQTVALQLSGATEGVSPDAATFQSDFLARRALRSSNYGLGQRATPSLQNEGAAVNPSAGAYFNDGEDGDFHAARRENLFDRNGDGVLSTAQQPTGKVGLMGVDVALPRTGKVYYFRALKGGSPIRVEASSTRPSTSGRVAMLILLLAAAALVGYAVKRRMGREES